jgi:hypothetical protein
LVLWRAAQKLRAHNVAFLKTAEVEWVFSPAGATVRAGSEQPVPLRWVALRVTRFPDGFVLSFGVKYASACFWLPAESFPAFGVAQFADMTQQFTGEVSRSET